MQVFDAEDFPRTTEAGGLSSARARVVFDTLGEGLIIWSRSGELLDCNRTAGEILGRPWSELRAMDFDELMAMAELEMAPVTEHGRRLEPSEFPAVEARRAGRAVVGEVLGITRPDGTRVWLEVDVRPVMDEFEGELIVTSFRDITDRRQAEAERVEAEERYRQGFERSAFGLGVLDLEQTFTSVNPALAELLGHTPDRLLGRRPLEFLHPTESESARTGIEQLLSGDVPFYKREHRMVRRDGSIVSVLIDMTLVPRRRRRAELLLRAGARHHRPQARRGGARAPGAARRPHPTSRTACSSSTASRTHWHAPNAPRATLRCCSSTSTASSS